MYEQLVLLSREIKRILRIISRYGPFFDMSITILSESDLSFMRRLDRRSSDGDSVASRHTLLPMGC